MLGLVAFGSDFKTRSSLCGSVKDDDGGQTPLDNIRRIGKLVTRRFAPHFLWSSLGVAESDLEPLVHVFESTINSTLQSKREAAATKAVDPSTPPQDLLDHLMDQALLSDADIKVYLRSSL